MDGWLAGWQALNITTLPSWLMVVADGSVDWTCKVMQFSFSYYQLATSCSRSVDACVVVWVRVRVRVCG